MAKIPVVFTFDKRIILGAAVSIKSLIDCANPETEYDIYVYHPDIDEKTEVEFKKMTEGTRHNITFEYISKDKFKNAPINKGGSWTEIVYYKLLLPELLTQYDKAIYSDVDVLFKGDLSELYNENIDNYEFAAVRAEKNTPDTICHKYFADNKNEYIFWSGLMLLNCKKFRDENLFDRLIENAKKYYNDLKFFDLDLINITCNNILPIDMKYCVMQSIFYNEDYNNNAEYQFLKSVYSDEEIENSKRNTIIIHYGGKLGKPWRMKRPYADYQEYIDKLPKALRRYTFRDLRKKFFSCNFKRKNPNILDIKKDTKCLLVAPHPDDDTIGIGGLLIKYAKNFDCICIGSSGVELETQHISPKQRSEMRIKEFREVMDYIGVRNYWIFETYGIPRFDSQMESHFDEYCDVLKDLKKYDYIFLPHPVDGHHEHRFITNKLFKRIVKKVGYNPNTKIVFYEVWADIEKPNMFFDISKDGVLYFGKQKTAKQQNNSKVKIQENDSLLNRKINVTTNFYKSQWDYDDITAVPAIKRQLATKQERYRVISVCKYMKLISFSLRYGIVGLLK